MLEPFTDGVLQTLPEKVHFTVRSAYYALMELSLSSSADGVCPVVAETHLLTHKLSFSCCDYTYIIFTS